MDNTTDNIPSMPSGSTSSDISPYRYTITQGVPIIFIVLFGLSTLIHTSQALFFRMWWLFPTICLAGIVEVLGWSGRLWSSFRPSYTNPFEIQITSTILAPTPLVAANFVILGRIIQRLGLIYSRLSPMRYTIIFASFDIISLIIQGIGGGMASAAADKTVDPTPGIKVMLGGVISQMVIITTYMVFAGEFFVRFFKDLPLHPPACNGATNNSNPARRSMDKRLKLMSISLVFSTLCLFIRAIYRTIELSNGWNGRIITTQVYFNVLDGAMVVLAIITLNFAHPGVLLAIRPSELHADNDSLATTKASLDNSDGAIA